LAILFLDMPIDTIEILLLPHLMGVEMNHLNKIRKEEYFHILIFAGVFDNYKKEFHY
jgi:hypothetical protein